MPLARIRALRDLATCLVGRLSTPPTPAPRKDTAILELPGRRHARWSTRRTRRADRTTWAAWSRTSWRRCR